MSAFTWDNLTLAVNIFKKSEPQTIFDKFSVFLFILLWAKMLFLVADTSVWINSYKLWLLCKSYQVLRSKCLYLEWSRIDCKKIQRLQCRLVLTVIHFFTRLPIGPNLYLYWLTVLSELTHTNCVSSPRVISTLEIGYPTWSNLELASKYSRECLPNHFWQFF